MKEKQFTHGITFFTTQEMYKETKRISDDRGIGVSDLLRQLIESYFKKIEAGGETESKEDHERK